jgi:hypothetical protein
LTEAVGMLFDLVFWIVAEDRFGQDQMSFGDEYAWLEILGCRCELVVIGVQYSGW